MVPVVPFPKVGRRGGLAGVLVLAALIRLPQITARLADNMQIKQVYVSNKPRSISRPLRTRSGTRSISLTSRWNV